MYASTLQTDKRIHVVDVRCGFGKGIAQQTFLNHITDNEFAFTKDEWGMLKQAGAIYVTDRKDRLERIFEYGGIAKHCYWLQTEADCQIPLEEQIVEQQEYPILIMTTQRYFQMAPSGLRGLKKWRNQDSEQERKLVIFDEKPQFIDIYTLSIKHLHSVGEALMNVLEYEGKGRLLESFEAVEREIFQEWDELSFYISEQQLKSHYTWVPADTESASETEFYTLVKDVKLPDHISQTIRAIRYRKSNGCFYVNVPTSKTQNRYYEIPMNNLDKFLLEDYSYWVFDATAGIDIEYIRLVDRLPFEYFFADDMRDENCQVVLTDLNTSKNKMDEEKYEMLLDYIAVLPKDTVIITYQEFEKKIKTEFPQYLTLHLGNTRGNNSLKDATRLLQIGLTRPRERYFLGMFLELYPEERHMLNAMEQNDIDEYIKNVTHLSSVMFSDERMNEILISMMAVDLEQNVFRSKLRQFGSNEFVRIEIICSAKYAPVLDKVFNKWGLKYEINTDSFKKLDNVRSDSHAKQVLDALEEMPFYKPFKTKDLYKAAGLTAKQFDKVRTTHGINELLLSYKIGHGLYMKM